MAAFRCSRIRLRSGVLTSVNRSQRSHDRGYRKLQKNQPKCRMSQNPGSWRSCNGDATRRETAMLRALC
eukprot:6189336-Pleurochrysis_carterae.AAC.2